LFVSTFLSEVVRMLIIAAGLTIALVAADLLDFTSRKEPGSGRTRLS
jgi:hypothetical protein